MKDARDAGVAQDDRAEGMPINEATHLIDVVEASYEEVVITLSSNTGEFLLLHVSVLTCMQGTTPMIMVTSTSFITH